MPKKSAGILLYRPGQQVEVMLVHPAGPYLAHKDKGAWSIPKGEFDDKEEEPLEAARREFAEETGQQVPDTPDSDEGPIDLGTVKLSNGKIIYIFAIQGEIDADHIISNMFTIEWPPKSENQQEFPEVDRAEWLTFDQAMAKLHPSLIPFLERLAKELGLEFSSPTQVSMFD